MRRTESWTLWMRLYTPHFLRSHLETRIAFAVLAGVALMFSMTRLLPAETTDPRSLLRDVRKVQFRKDGLAIEKIPDVASDSAGASPMLAQEDVAPDGENRAPKADRSLTQPSAPNRRPPSPIKSFFSHLSLLGGRNKLKPTATPEGPEPEQPAENPPVLLPPPDDTSGQDASSTSPPNLAPQPISEFPSAAIPLSPGMSTPTPLPTGGILISPRTQSMATPSPTLRPSSPRVGILGEESATPFPSRSSRQVATPFAPRHSDMETLAESTSSGNTLAAEVSLTSSVSSRLQPADLAPPNDRVEPREEVRHTYIEALAKAREGHTAAAAQQLRSFARTYPSSVLAPRALFLAALLAEDPQLAAEDVNTLQRFFPTSDYLTELKLRGVASGDTRMPSPEQVQQPGEPGDRELSSPLRAFNRVRDHVEDLIRDKRYAEALIILEQIPNGAYSPDVLDFIAQCQLGLGDNRSAIATIARILENFPNYDRRQAIRLNYALLLEDASQYERARAEYRKIIDESPDSDEARAARARLEQLNALTQ